MKKFDKILSCKVFKKKVLFNLEHNWGFYISISNDNIINFELFDKNFTWLDSGTHGSMLEASNYIHTIEKRTGLKIACVEEIAFKLGYINHEQFGELIKSIGKNQYGSYLESILNGI